MTSQASQETVRLTFSGVSKTTNSILSYGLPFHVACHKHVEETFYAKRVYIIASKTLSEKTAFLHQLQQSLGEKVAGTWIGLPNHTPADALIPIVQDARTKGADCLVTLGGGSISDGAKLISLALANDVESMDDLMKLPRLGEELSTTDVSAKSNPPQVPVICIPISLSGGEYSRYAGVTDASSGFKHQFTHEQMYPALLILDPQITISTPMSLWLSSGVRAIDHCVEGFLSRNATPEGDVIAQEGLIELVDGLLRTIDHPDELGARLKCQLGSNKSMTLLFLEIAKGASHGIGHQLGPVGVSHGATSCILLPAVCKYNAEVNHDKQAILKDLLLNKTVAREIVQHDEVLDLGDVLRAIFNALGMPKTLRDVGVEGHQLQALARNCVDEVYVKSNPRPIKDTAAVMEILAMVQE